jgi:hypothetical protein
VPKRKAIRWLSAAALASAIIAVAGSPAYAETSSGHHDNFWYSCDASVYITDDLIGSPGKIEAWGGFACLRQYWGGVMRLKIRKNGATVKEVVKNVPGGAAMTDHIDATVANSSGRQNWSATLTMSRPGMDTLVISTGVIPS